MFICTCFPHKKKFPLPLYHPYIGVSQNRPMLFDLDGRERKLGLGIKKKNAPMGRGGPPPTSLVGAILSIF